MNDISNTGSPLVPDDTPPTDTATSAKASGLSGRTLGIAAAGAAIGSAAIAAAVLYARRPEKDAARKQRSPHPHKHRGGKKAK